jgi:hypothetical protein
MRRQADPTERELRLTTGGETPFADSGCHRKLERRLLLDLEWKPRGRSSKPTPLAAVSEKVQATDKKWFGC